MDAKHSCQAILADAGRVHPQLKVRIDVSIQGHGSLSFDSGGSIRRGPEKAVLAIPLQIQGQSLSALFVNILLPACLNEAQKSFQVSRIIRS